MTRQPTIHKGTVLRLGVILAVALLLRVLMLTKESLWLDEIASWMFASQKLPQVLRSEVTNPPLYYALLHFWIGWFGTGEAAMRILSVLPGVCSVWLVFHLASKLFSRPVAYVAMVYDAISTFQIYYSQEMRCFSLLVCLLLITGLCLWNALAETGRRRLLYFAGVTLFGTISLYTHFISVFFLASYGAYVLFRRPKQVIAVGASLGAAMLLFAPWLMQMLAAAGGGGQIRRYLLLKLPQAYFSFLFGDTLIPLDEQAVRHIPQTLRANWWILTLAVASLAVFLPFLLRAWKRWGESMTFVLTMAVLPVLMAFVVSFKIMMFDERYLIGASPFLYIAIVAAIAEIPAAARNSQSIMYAGWAACAGFGVLLAVSLANYYFNPRFGKEQWREADAYIDGLVPAATTGLVVFDPDYLRGCYEYYSQRHLPEWRITQQVAGAIVESPALLRDQTGGYQHIVLVRAHEDHDAVLNAMRGALSEESERIFSKANPIEIYSFRPR